MILSRRFLPVVLSFAAGSLAYADVKLPAILSDHMVLQAGKPASIWGWADPQEKVTVKLGKSSAQTVAGADGRWALKVALPKGEGPFELQVTGNNSLTVTDVLVGEVWLCSGQSNMAWTVKQANQPETEIPAATFPKIRHFKVQNVIAAEPQEDLKGSWVVCSPETVGGFTAVGYFFGRHLHQQLNAVPVGLVGSNWGGTVAEAWTSRKALEAAPELKPMLDSYADKVAKFDPVKAKEAFDKATEAWPAQVEKAKADKKPLPRKPVLAVVPHQNPNYPANLYNSMISPLLRLSIRGAIWYQGESNVSRAYQYRTLFPTMISNWRKDFAQGDFPFLFVQLAPYGYNRANPNADRSPCAELWEAQLLTLKKVPNTGMAVTTDLGNITDIHPKNKQDVGQRLALWALSKTYDKKGVVYSGPLYKESKVEKDKVRIAFTHSKGIKARNGEALTHFTIAGEDQKFVPAVATVDGESLLVSSPDMAKPVAVRFAWSEDAEPNLVNGAGLPASPFRTDDFPAVTAANK
jgi:sialate O-acetylesterase